MDKSTLSGYGWIIIVTLILAVMLALATPFGTYVGDGVVAVANSFVKSADNAMDEDNIDKMAQEWEGKLDYSAVVNTGDAQNKKGVIPAGAKYYIGSTSTAIGQYTNATTILEEGDLFPKTINDGDVFIYGDYEYKYNYRAHWGTWSNNSSQDGWGVRVLNKNKTSYDAVLGSINNKNITNMSGCYYQCVNLSSIDGLTIPSTVTQAISLFRGCSSLTDVSSLNLPSATKDITWIFIDCTSLANNGLPTFPNTVTTMDSAFSGCTSLTDVSHFVFPTNVTSASGLFSGTSITNNGFPVIPNTITNISSMFRGCTAITDASKLIIPNGVKNMNNTFENCTSLVNVNGLNIPNSVVYMESTFRECTAIVDASGLIIPTSVEDMDTTFYNCTKLKTAPTIPYSVESMDFIFRGCTSLTGTIIINTNNLDNYSYSCDFENAFAGVNFKTQNLKLAGTSSKLDAIGATGTNYCATCNGACNNNH